MSKPLRLLIVDACVLIDFCHSDRSVLTLVTRHVGDVFVATPVLDEVDELDESDAAELGLKLVVPTLEIASAAAGAGRGLSFRDALCLMLAKEHGWVCVSNDRRLRRCCGDEGVDVLWGLELLALLVDRGALSGESAKEIALQVVEQNRYIKPEVYQRFLQRIGVGDD